MNFFKKFFLQSKKELPVETEIKEVCSTQLAPAAPIILKEEEPKPLSDEEIERKVNEMATNIFLHSSISYINEGDTDPMLQDAARIIIDCQSGSTALLQRRMKLGYNRAGRLMDQLEAAGIVGPSQGSKVRNVLIKTAEEYNKLLSGDLAETIQMKMKLFYDKHKEEIQSKVEQLEDQEQKEKIRKEKEVIRLALLEKERKRNLQKLALEELKNEGLINQYKEKRTPIPQDVMDSVWNRDGGICVNCGSNQNLEFDHIIPFSKGGANTYRNLQLLCEKCNIEKSNKIG